MQYNAIARTPRTLNETEADHLIDSLAGYSAALGHEKKATTVTITVKAANAPQAVRVVLGLLDGMELDALEVLPTAEFDSRIAEPDDVVTVAEAARALGITPQGVRRRIAAGTLPAARRGRAWLVPARALASRR